MLLYMRLLLILTIKTLLDLFLQVCAYTFLRSFNNVLCLMTNERKENFAGWTGNANSIQSNHVT